MCVCLLSLHIWSDCQFQCEPDCLFILLPSSVSLMSTPDKFCHCQGLVSALALLSLAGTSFPFAERKWPNFRTFALKISICAWFAVPWPMWSHPSFVIFLFFSFTVTSFVVSCALLMRWWSSTFSSNYIQFPAFVYSFVQSFTLFCDFRGRSGVLQQHLGYCVLLAHHVVWRTCRTTVSFRSGWSQVWYDR